MVKSMTGFGKSEVTLPNRKITVEIRSLNSKQMALSLRLPAIYRQSAYEIRNAVARALRRGKVDVFVSVESQAVETSAHINGQVLAAYAGELREAARGGGFDTTGPGWEGAALQDLMRLTDAVCTDEDRVSEQEHAALLTAVEEA